jgi:integrase/recombinase XerD
MHIVSMTQVSLDDLLVEMGEVRTLREALALFEAVGMGERKLSPRTRREYRNDLTDLLRFLEKRGVVELGRVQLSFVEEYQTELVRRGQTPSSQQRKTYAIKTFFQFLYKHEVIEHDVAERLIPPVVERQEPRVLTDEECTALRRVCQANARDAAIIELYLATGMTLLELVRLRRSDVELPKQLAKGNDEVGVVHVRRRRGRVNTVPLTYEASRVLAAYLKKRPPVVTDRLFLSRFYTPYSVRAVQYMVGKYLERIGLSDATVRTLRHSMAVRQLAHGTPLSAVQEALGHTSPDTTAVYIPLAKKVRQKAPHEHAL